MESDHLFRVTSCAVWPVEEVTCCGGGPVEVCNQLWMVSIRGGRPVVEG